MLQVAQQIHTDFGAVDILICNAGVMQQELIHLQPSKHIKQVLDVNLMGYFWVGSKKINDVLNAT